MSESPLSISEDEDGALVDQTLYMSMMGSLLYLTASRHDITYFVGLCALYRGEDSHIPTYMKRTFKYMSATTDYSIWFTDDTSSNLFGFRDAYLAGNAEDWKSTSGGCFFLRNNILLWFSKKLKNISLSTLEVECIVIRSSCTHVIWIKQMLEVYGVQQDVMTL